MIGKIGKLFAQTAAAVCQPLRQAAWGPARSRHHQVGATFGSSTLPHAPITEPQGN